MLVTGDNTTLAVAVGVAVGVGVGVIVVAVSGGELNNAEERSGPARERVTGGDTVLVREEVIATKGLVEAEAEEEEDKAEEEEEEESGGSQGVRRAMSSHANRVKGTGSADQHSI